MVIILSIAYIAFILLTFHQLTNTTECNYNNGSFTDKDVEIPATFIIAIKSVLWPLLFTWWFTKLSIWIINETVIPFIFALVNINYKDTKTYKNIYKWAD